MNKYSDINVIECTTVNVDEQINEKYLKSFLIDKINHIDISIKDIYYSYLSFSQQYQVIYSKSLIPFFYSFKEYYHYTNDNSTDMFYTNEYFVIYINKEFYFYKKSNNNTIEEILKYVKYELKLNINNVINIKKETIEIYKNKYKHKIIEYKSSLKSLSTIVIYTLFLSLSLFIFYNSNKSFKSDTRTYIIEKTKKVYFSKEIQKLFNLLYIYKIKIIHFQYANNELVLNLYCKDINKLYKFIKNENFIMNFTYEKVKKGYFINANFNFM